MHASQVQELVCRPLWEKYRDLRSTTVQLTKPFSAEDQMLQSMPDASPVKWHLAHTTWFFETFVLAEHIPGYKPFDPRYRHLFNSYYKQLGSHPYRGSRGLMSRPSLDEVYAYRRWLDDAMERHFDQLAEDAGALIELGINHEQQHQELILTDIKHALWSMPLRPDGAEAGLQVRTRRGAWQSSVEPSGPKAPNSRDGDSFDRFTAGSECSPRHWISFEGGIYPIGHTGEGFAFDNEGPRHEVLLQRFQIGSRQVANAEYLEFIRDGGYRRPELWLSDGWDAVCAQGWNSPLYWEQRDGTWLEFTFQGTRAIDPAEPVCHVSYFEADAFARWSDARLPREEEWEVTAFSHPLKTAKGGAASQKDVNAGAFLDDRTFHPCPAAGNGPLWFGNVWEWTASPYVAYPGFAAAAGAIGEYNGKFMCNQFVLRGGSCATPRSHIRASYRNFFPPHARWQFMGIRLAK